MSSDGREESESGFGKKRGFRPSSAIKGREKGEKREIVAVNREEEDESVGVRKSFFSSFTRSGKSGPRS